MLRQQVGLPADDLIRESARLLGYTRMGSALRQAMADGISYGVRQGILEQSQSEYFTLPSDGRKTLAQN